MKISKDEALIACFEHAEEVIPELEYYWPQFESLFHEDVLYKLESVLQYLENIQKCAVNVYGGFDTLNKVRYELNIGDENED